MMLRKLLATLGGIVALSERDKRVLAQMEAQLSSTDPDFASRMRLDATQADTRKNAGQNVRSITIGIALFLVGVCLLIGGVVLSSLSTFMMFVGPVVGVLGFLVMVYGVMKMFFSSKPRSALSKKGKGKKTFGGRGDFMRRQEERWDRRQR